MTGEQRATSVDPFETLIRSLQEIASASQNIEAELGDIQAFISKPDNPAFTTTHKLFSHRLKTSERAFDSLQVPDSAQVIKDARREIATLKWELKSLDTSQGTHAGLKRRASDQNVSQDENERHENSPGAEMKANITRSQVDAGEEDELETPGLRKRHEALIPTPASRDMSRLSCTPTFEKAGLSAATLRMLQSEELSPGQTVPMAPTTDPQSVKVKSADDSSDIEALELSAETLAALRDTSTLIPSPKSTQNKSFELYNKRRKSNPPDDWIPTIKQITHRELREQNVPLEYEWLSAIVEDINIYLKRKYSADREARLVPGGHISYEELDKQVGLETTDQTENVITALLGLFRLKRATGNPGDPAFNVVCYENSS